MSKLILITGGCRSGKSSHALALARELPGAHIFIATCPVFDDEMAQRVARHRQERSGQDWRTIEEQIELVSCLRANPEGTVLIDCLTLWLNNLIYHEGENPLDEDTISRQALELAATARKREGTTILVTNELGLGVVPENPLARRFRDLMGRCNASIAREADQVIMMISGLPLTVK